MLARTVREWRPYDLPGHGVKVKGKYDKPSGQLKRKHQKHPGVTNLIIHITKFIEIVVITFKLQSTYCIILCHVFSPFSVIEDGPAGPFSMGGVALYYQLNVSLVSMGDPNSIIKYGPRVHFLWGSIFYLTPVTAKTSLRS